MKINFLAASLEAPELTERLGDLAQKMVRITDKGHMKSLHSQTHGFFPQGESEDGASASEAKAGCPSVTPVPSDNNPELPLVPSLPPLKTGHGCHHCR